LDFLIANPDENKVNSYFKITYLILIFSALSWLIFGFGYSQYSIDNVGTRGFFLAGNELGIIHIITTFYFLRKYLNKSLKIYTLFLILSLILAILFATKVAVIGVIIVGTLLPLLLFSFSNMKKIKLITIRISFGLVFFIGILLPSAIKYLLEDVGLGRRLDFWIEKVDLVTLFFSGRNLLAQDLFFNIIPQLSIIDWTLGLGLNEIKILIGRSIELDALDFFSFFGMLGLTVYLVLFFKLFRLSQGTQNIFIRRSNLLLILLLFFISNTAGHVITGGLAIFSIALIFIQHEK
jgi:hypothetical protein